MTNMQYLGMLVLLISTIALVLILIHQPKQEYVTRKNSTGYIDPTALIRVFKSKELNSDASLTHADK